MTRTLFSLLLVLAGCPIASAQDAPKADPAPPPVDAGVTAYRHVLRSSVWIHSDRGGGRLATGSGSLVDRGRRLVLTNYHVVGEVKKATVFFPEYGPDKKAIPERRYYLDRAGKFGIPGEVVEVDKEGDLALIRIDRVPDGVPALTLASSSPDPGQTVHSIGNPGKSGALWVYTPGKVRQVYSKKWQAKLDEKTVHTFHAKVIETDSPTNPGDSGGPLVNDRGELVGITQGGAIDAQSLSIFVDLSEVKRILGRRSVQALRSTESTATTQPKEPPKPHRETAVKIKDEGKFFSEETLKKAQTAVDRLLKEKDVDLFIETIPTLPEKDVDRVIAMTPTDREKFFKEYALERCKTEKVSGVYLLVCKKPTYLEVEMSGPAASSFPAGFGTKVRNVILAAFKEKKFDVGLEEGIKLVLEAKGVGEKPKETSKLHRDAALKSKDEAKFFSEEALKKAQAAADKLLKEKDVDLFIETISSLPPKDAERVAAMTAADREKFFKDYALERCKEEKVSGVYVLVCKKPGYVYVEMSGAAASKFPAGFGSKLKTVILSAFQEKKFDGGLGEAVQLVLEAQGLGEKK